MSISVAVVGATGRMGKLAIELIEAAQDLSLFAALDSKSDIAQTNGADVVIDLTRFDVSQQVVEHALANNQKLVVGTSGWSASHLQQLEKKLETSSAAVVVIPNFSIGSMLATKFASEAAKFFDSIEIVETHHAGKIDSPSGTAVRTAELIAKSRDGKAVLVPGVGQQARGEIVAGVPIHSLRIDGVSAKQDVLLGAESELLTLSHETTSVRAYSAGILASIRFAAKSTGLTVGLQSVLEL
jgi:4-hydroxy-tetrahydrodipicolinate reductase